MNRRQLMLASAAVFAAAWSSHSTHAEERIDPALVAWMPNAKITLQQAVTAAAQEGKPQQLNQFVDLINAGRDAIDAIHLVNDEAMNPTACGNALAAFEIGKTLAAVKMLGELVNIVEVRVTALSVGSEWTRVPPNHAIHTPPDSRQDVVMGRLAVTAQPASAHARYVRARLSHGLCPAAARYVDTPAARDWAPRALSLAS